MENIIIVNPEQFEHTKKRMQEDGADKFHVLSDFDRTITKGFVEGQRSPTAISQFRNGGYLTADYAPRAFAYYDIYHPIEIDPHIPREEKAAKMDEWWNLHFDLLVECGLTKSVIQEVAAKKTLQFRDAFARDMGCSLVVKHVQDSIDRGRVREEIGLTPSRNALQTVTLLDAIKELSIDAALGGARRDEEKALAKERVFSHRDAFGQWEPRNQRPEVWSLFNGRKNPGEHFRVFPLSNWTELDIWQYIEAERISLPSLYFAHQRAIVRRDGMLIAKTSYTRHCPARSRRF